MLNALLATTSGASIRVVLQDIGDHADLGLDQPFGPFHLVWHAFGNNPSNISTINLGTKPGRSLTERLTNAMDAILEDRVPVNVPTPRSAREAAKQWFGRPITGPDEGLFKWSFSDHGYDRRIAVVVNSSGVETAPTIDVVDAGIGLSPEQFPGTILSLQSGNKIQKWYLIGAFGQGGASALSFCEYAFIVSRHKDNPKVAGFTIIKVLALNEQYKEDTYAYLALKDAAGNLTVPSCELELGPLSLYQPQKGLKLPTLAQGTLVRHIAYQLPYLEGSLSPTPGNLYHFLHCSMFDPLFPFRLFDLRDADRARDELITGSRNRLMRLVKTKEPQPTEEEKGSDVKHHRQMEYIVPPGTQDPCIGIEYWVVFNYRKGTGAKREELVLRPQSNVLYVQTGHPIIGTLNGQNQGEITAQMLRDIGLGMVARHVIIHIDSTNANSLVRRQLFATTREGFKNGPILTELTRVLRKMLEEDENLYAIERELTEKLVKHETQTTSEEVKRQVTRLLLEAGLQVEKEGPSVTAGAGELQPVRKQRTGKPTIYEPLPTLPFPEVTKFVIVYPKPKMTVRLNDIEVLLAETDGDAEFDRRRLVAIRSEPDCMELATKSALRGGRIRWRLRPRETAKVGDAGRIVATLTKPDGSQISDTTEFEVLPALEEKTKKAKGLIPPFEIIPINPIDDAEQWVGVWPDLGDEAGMEEQASVAYRPLKVGHGINVYYSTIFSPFKDQVEKLKSESPAMADLFRTNYEIWIGYHAILQENTRNMAKAEIADEILDRLLEVDRIRVAQMQVKQAMRTAELTQRAMRDQLPE
jgi:hypothetical protein